MDAKSLELRARKTFAFKKTHNEKKEKNTPEYQQWRESVSEANRKKAADPEIAKRLADANRNRKERLGPEYSKRASEAQRRRYENLTQEERQVISDQSKARWKDQEYRQRMMDYYSTSEYKKYIKQRNKEVAQRPEMKEWYKEFNKAKRSDPAHIEKHQAGVADRSNNNEDWIRKNCRPVSTPYGIFQKAKDVMDLYHAENGGKRESVGVKLRSWLKSDKKPDWNYLTWEEYDKLKETV